MVDERVAVPLRREDDLVSCPLDIVGRVLVVPFEQGRQDPHVGGILRVRVVGDDQGAVVGQDEVRLL